MKVEWTKTALLDLDSIRDRIFSSSPVYAKITVEIILDRCGQLEAFPMSGSAVPEYGREDIREIFEYSYRIIHQTTKESVFILSVLHASNPLPQKPPTAV